MAVTSSSSISSLGDLGGLGSSATDVGCTTGVGRRVGSTGSVSTGSRLGSVSGPASAADQQRRRRSTSVSPRRRGGDGDRHRAGGRRQVDVLVGLAERRQLGDDVDGDEAGPLERLQQAVAPVDQLLDLLAGELAPARQLRQHPLAVGPGLLDHLPALLLGHRQLGLGVGGGVGAAPAGLELGLLADALGLVGGLAEQPAAPSSALAADRRGALAGGLQDPRRLLAEQPRRRLVVDAGPPSATPFVCAARSSRSRKRSRSCSRASSAATMRRKSRTSCWSNPRRAVPNAASATAAGEDGSGREKEMAIVTSVNVRARPIAAISRRAGSGSPPRRSSAASASSSVATGMISTSSPAISLARAELLLALGGRDEEVLDADLAHGRHLLGQPADRADAAVEVDLAGDGDVRAAGQVARRTARRSASA